MATQPKKKRVRARPARAPAPATREASPATRRSFPWFAVLVAAAAIGIAWGVYQTSSSTPAAAPAHGLPQTPDYHSLIVSKTDPTHILLGTHQGVYASNDGGRVWHFDGLAGQDAMNLARPDGETLWMAGHEAMARSTDAGKTWQSVRPTGLPDYDVHGFAAAQGGTLYAAVAGHGLYRSTDGGASFGLASKDIGGAVMALGVEPGGAILAGDMDRGLLESRDGGKTWKRLLDAQLAGIAVDPADPRRIIATGEGILLSTDGGASWRKTLELRQGAGPVAWAPGEPGVAYAVGYDRNFYRSQDGGLTWHVVS